MNVKSILNDKQKTSKISHLLSETGICDQLIKSILLPKILIFENRLYLKISFEDIDVSQVSNPSNFCLMKCVATKYMIPIPQSFEPTTIQTVILTSERTRIIESESVAKSGDFIVINNPTESAVTELNNIWSNNEYVDPREKILLMLSAAKINGSENIFPANKSFETVLETCGQPITIPGLYHLKSTYLRAVSRFPGPTIIDQSNSWGPTLSGAPNYQFTPNTVFIVHLDENCEPIYSNGVIKANSYDLKPFLEDYRTINDESVDINTFACYVPVVRFKGQLSQFNCEEIKKIGNTLLIYNRNFL